MKFIEQAGKMAIGSRIRFLSEEISAEAAKIYGLYGTELQPKWFPVFYSLSKNKESTVTSISDEIGHSHVSVIKILREMGKAGLITEKSDKDDRRRNLLRLSKKGLVIAGKIQAQYRDVNAAVEELISQSKHNLWEALNEWENLLMQKSLYERVLQKKKLQESSKVKIVPYRATYQKAFRKLNEEWISTYFKMEKPDYDALDNPQKYIIDNGGVIFVALLNDVPVGVCALLKRKDLKTYELAKMAVDPKAKGKGIGYLLGLAAIEKARELRSKTLYLESNTILKPAISLYKKLGFKKIKGPPTPYERCNIQMEIIL